MKYVYPAVFTPTTDVPGFFVEFPDDSSIFTDGSDLYDAIEMAEDVLALSLVVMEDEGKPIPAASDIKDIKVDVENAFVTLIKADTDSYRKLLADMKNRGEL